MASIIKVKRSSVPGKVPANTDIDLGEFAINTYDGKVFIKKNNGINSIVEITGGGSSSNSSSSGVSLGVIVALSQNIGVI